MSNELTLPANITPSKYVLDDKTFSSISSGGGFLARLQLFGSNSDAAKEGKINMGNYGLVVAKEIEDLGKEVQCFILSWRPLALKIDAEKNVINVFDTNSQLFKDIQLQSEEQDSGCMFGQRAV